MKYSILKRRVSIIITLSVILLDQLSKSLAYSLLLNNTITIIPGILDLNLAINTGAAFSMLNNSVVILKYISLIASIIILILIMKKFYSSKIEQISLSFLLAGSIGNGIDRWFHGYVIDFIEIKAFSFPIFNIADISINIAVALLLIDLGFKRYNKKIITNVRNTIKSPLKK